MATKEELEIKKIEAELLALHRPFYKTTTFWISVTTAIVAVGGFVGQSFVSKIERAQAVVDRDRALLAQEHAKKELSAIESERASKRTEIERLSAEAEERGYQKFCA